MSYVPTNKVLPVNNIIINTNRIIRDIKLKSYFCNSVINNKNEQRKFVEKSDWIPPSEKLNGNVLNLCDKIGSTVFETIKETVNQSGNNNKCKNAIAQLEKQYVGQDSAQLLYGLSNLIVNLDEKSNIDQIELDSIKGLKNNKDIIIKPADKGGATVIMDKKCYIDEALRQLNNKEYYREIPKPIFMDNKKKIDEILKEMQKNKFINRKQFKYLSGPQEIKERAFYLLPKIHKPKETWPQPNKMPEGRPIVSDIDSETYRISEYINNFLHPLSIKHNSYIKNSYEFVNKIKNFAINNNCLLVTGDITALYTNMEISRSIQCFEEMLSKTSGEKRPDKELVELLELSLRNNDFMFNSKHYLQTKGTAMGKRFAPALANIYLLEFDEKATNGYKTKPILYFRYIDDIFFLWPGNAQSLAEYEQYLNNLIPSISIKLKHSNTEIDFLDVTIYKSDDVLKTKVYFRDTDTHQLLHKDSFHPSTRLVA